MKKIILAIGLITTFFYSCENDPTSAYLNVKNETTLPLEGVTIYLGGIVHNYGKIDSGKTSGLFLFYNTFVADSIVFEYDNEVTIFRPNNGLFQWPAMEIGATYTYTIGLDQNNEPKYEVGKVN